MDDRRAAVTTGVTTVVIAWGAADSAVSLVLTRGEALPLVGVMAITLSCMAASLVLHRRGHVSFRVPAWSTLVGFAVTVLLAAHALGPESPYVLFGALLPLVGAMMLGPKGAVASVAAVVAGYLVGGWAPGAGWMSDLLAPRPVLTAWVLATMSGCAAAITWFYERATKQTLDELSRAVAGEREARERAEASHEQLVHSGRLAALGQLAGSVAHELNNPLASIGLRAEFLAEDLAAGAEQNVILGHAEQIQSAALASGEVIQNLLQFARRGARGARTTIDLARVVNAVGALVRPQFQRQGTALQLDVPEGLTVQGAEAELRQVLTNLLINAAQALGEGGVVTVDGRRRGDDVELSVQDDGPGMEPAVAERIFEPFFTTRDEGGTGLGLSISYGIITSHEGTVTVDTAPGDGCRFTLTFPWDPRAANPSAPVRARVDLRGVPVLVVEDDEHVLDSVIEGLTRAGATPRRAPGMAEALEILRRERVQILVTDQRMPGGLGLDLIAEARRAHPVLATILISGELTADEIARARTLGADVVHKPFESAELLETIRVHLPDRRQ